MNIGQHHTLSARRAISAKLTGIKRGTGRKDDNDGDAV